MTKSSIFIHDFIYILLLVSFLLPANVIAQQPEFSDVEIRLHTINAEGSMVKITLIPISRIYNAVDSYCIKSIRPPQHIAVYQEFLINENYTGIHNGYNYKSADNPDIVKYYSDYEHVGSISNGLYKMEIRDVTEVSEGILIGVLYIDTRHDDFIKSGSCSNSCDQNDSILKIDVRDKKFFMASNNKPLLFQQIPSGFTINYWELTNCTSYSTNFFEDKRFNTLNLSVVSDHPHLTWNAPPIGVVNYYQVQRAKGSNDFITIFTTASTTYTDITINVDENGNLTNNFIDRVQYRIKYVTDDTYTDYSNTVLSFIESYNNGNLEKSAFAEYNAINSFELYQNYPNPFNPTTTITFCLEKDEIISLKLFNSLGQIVNTIYEGIGNEGLNSMELSLENLSSGIYYYTLSNSKEIKTQKLLLVK